jgi:hypothetical protein
VFVEFNVQVRSFALLGILVGASACADNSVTAPITKTPALRLEVASVSARRPTRFANTIKYRDKGKKHARALAGVASLEARALLGRDGGTILDISTGAIDGAPGAGVLSKIQLKLYAPDGALQTTTNYKGLSTPVYQLTLPGRVRGSRIQVQGSIVGIDGKHADVVTLNETVKLRPDLSVDRITAPAQSRVRMPVNISAMISEQNGDVGARADCVLAVDGVEVDRAHGIWVDAGRSVSCLFSHVFPATGTKRLTVSAISVSPGDWDPANNSAAVMIEIVLPPNQFTWQGSYVAIRDWTGSSFTEGYWTRPDVGDRADWSFNQVVHHADSWAAHVGGHVPAMSGPITFSLHDEIDGTPLNRVEFDPNPDMHVTAEGTEEDPVLGTVHYQTSCTTSFQLVPAVFEGQDVLISPAWLTVCTWLRSGPSGPLPDRSFTDFNYSTSAGDVSYYGEDWQQYEPGPNDTGSSGYTFSFNGETAYTYGTLAFGNAYRFTLSISGSELTKTASGTIHLSAPNVIVVSQPYGCDDFSDPTFFTHFCWSANYTQTLIQGSASGTPDQ